MTAVAIVSALVLFVCAALALGWLGVTAPERRQLKVEMRRVERDLNHQDLFLLVNDLLVIQERGYQVVFPDAETLERARRLTNQYRQETQ